MTELETTMLAAWGEYWARTIAEFPHVKKPTFGPFDTPDKKCKHRRTFEKIAQWCISNHVDPKEFITGAMPIVKAASATILPRDFAQESIFRQFLRAKSGHVVGNPEEYWAGQKRLLRQFRWLNPKFTDDMQVLQLLGMPFTAWFRVMYPQPPNPDLLHDYGQPAWGELRNDRRLRDFLRSKRPVTMHELEIRIASFGDMIT